MLYYVVLCYVMLCCVFCVRLCCVVSCHVMLRCVVLCYVMLWVCVFLLYLFRRLWWVNFYQMMHVIVRFQMILIDILAATLLLVASSLITDEITNLQHFEAQSSGSVTEVNICEKMDKQSNKPKCGHLRGAAVCTYFTMFLKIVGLILLKNCVCSRDSVRPISGKVEILYQMLAWKWDCNRLRPEATCDRALAIHASAFAFCSDLNEYCLWYPI